MFLVEGVGADGVGGIVIGLCCAWCVVDDYLLWEVDFGACDLQERYLYAAYGALASEVDGDVDVAAEALPTVVVVVPRTLLSVGKGFVAACAVCGMVVAVVVGYCAAFGFVVCGVCVLGALTYFVAYVEGLYSCLA